MLYLFIKFVHVIAAMVFFGLPFAFGRWYKSLARSDHQVFRHGLRLMRQMALIYLNLTGFVVIATGLYLALTSGLMQAAGWIHLGILLTVLALINVNVLLISSLGSIIRNLSTQGAQEGSTRRIRLRVMVFSAIHHTLVTAATALMIFRPIW